MTAVRIAAHPRGPRVYVAGRRVHHGPPALVAYALAVYFRRRTLARLAWRAWQDDVRDFPFRDRDNH